MTFFRLSESFENYLSFLVVVGVLDVEIENSLLKSRKFSSFVDDFRSFLGFNSVERQDFVWRVVRDRFWDKKYFRGFDGSFFVFSSFESLVFDFLVRNGGVVDYRLLGEGGVLCLYEGKLRKVVCSLEEQGLVERLVVFPRRSLLVFHREFLKEVVC